MQWKVKDKTKWYKWFAWFPVCLNEPHTWVWLEYVYIKKADNALAASWEGRTRKDFVAMKLSQDKEAE